MNSCACTENKEEESVCLIVCESVCLSVCLFAASRGRSRAGASESCVNDSVECELSCVVFNFIAASVRRRENHPEC